MSRMLSFVLIKKLRGRSDSQLIQICRHGAASRPLKEAAERGLIHMKALREPGELDLFRKILI